MDGRPSIRDLPVTVGMIRGAIGAGRTVDRLIEDYPYLEHGDILEAPRHALWRLEERQIEPANDRSKCR